jgi:hypothetical protein
MLPPERVVQVLALCDLVKDRYPDGRLAFAVRYQREEFDRATGEYLSAAGRGLTCATFVLALFQSIGIGLLALETWRVREEDIRWHLEIIVPQLESTSADPAHVDEVRRQSPCARFRPQEVVAAMTTDLLPVTFDYAEPVGEAIRINLPIIR